MEQTVSSRRTEEEHGQGFLRTPIIPGEETARTNVSLDERHQGWMETPHGGILMSMILELAHRGLAPPLFHEAHYPLQAAFRLGGPPLSIQDRVEVGTRREEGRLRGWVRKNMENAPASVQASIRCRQPIQAFEGLDMARIHTSLGQIGRDSGHGSMALPYSKSCFVCGTERKEPGLERRFYCVEGGEARIAFTYVGLDPDDQDRFHRFRLDDGQAHPGTLVALLDETLGWSGFLRTRQGGVTVRLEVDILRPVDPGEKLLCFGVCTGTRGRDPQRQFWFAEGAVLPMGDDDFSPVMTARGQWMSIPKLTDEMKRHLMPREWLLPWFAPDGP